MKRNLRILVIIGVLAGSSIPLSAYSDLSSIPPLPSVSSASLTAPNSGGEYITDSRGRSLYVFDADTSGVSKCMDECARAWPPLIVPPGIIPTGAGTVSNSMVSTLQRPDGTLQVTYNGMPLYYSMSDEKPGDVRGQGVTGFGGKWFLIRPDGSRLMTGVPGATSNQNPI